MALALLAVGMLGTSSAAAEAMPRRVRDRCIRSAVQVVAIDDNGRSLGTGSGSIIDPRGYVLTNFHVVGRTRPEHGGLTGELFNSQGTVLLGMVQNDRERVQPMWVGRVVRGSPELDLALIRILRDRRTEQPVGRRRFPAVRFAPDRSIRAGTSVWAIGFPLSVPTVNVTAGTVNGFQLNYRSQPSWIRTDAEFNPGNSGGMLVDKKCRLVGVPTQVTNINTDPRRGARVLAPVEQARPVSRVPREWLRAMRRGHIDDVQIDDVPAVAIGQTTYVNLTGDTAGVADLGALYWLHLPPMRPATVKAEGYRIPMIVLSADGRGVAEGRGEVRIPPNAPEKMDLAIVIPANLDQVPRIGLRFVPEQAPPRVVVQRVFVGGGGAPATAEASHGSGQLHADVVPLGPGGGVAAAPAPAAGGGAVAVGQAVTASGQPAARALVVLGKPGVDLAARAVEMGSGQMTAEQFFQRYVAGRTLADAQGRFSVTGVVPGATQVLMVLHQPTNSIGVTTVRGAGGAVQVGTVRLNQ